MRRRGSNIVLRIYTVLIHDSFSSLLTDRVTNVKLITNVDSLCDFCTYIISSLMLINVHLHDYIHLIKFSARVNRFIFEFH